MNINVVRRIGTRAAAVATAIGLALTIHWQLGLAVCGTWLLMAAVFRYSSLAAMTSWVLAPLYAGYLVSWDLVYSLIPLSILLLIRHKENIQKLLNGTESKIGASKSNSDSAPED